MSRTGGHAVVDALDGLGVEKVFAIASIHNLPILEAIVQRGSIEIVTVRHEQNAVHMADGYARASGKLGVAIVSTGPGTANAVGGMYEAKFASSPVLLLTGQVESKYYGAGRAYIHEAEQQLGMLETVTKGTWSVRQFEDIGSSVADAGTLALSGRKGPTAVEIPIDFQYRRGEYPPVAVVATTVPAPNPVRIGEIVALLENAERPIIWAGGGTLSGEGPEAVRAFAEKYDIPVVTSPNGRGVLDENHDLCLGSFTTSEPVRAILEDADVLIALGTRFQYYPTAFWTIDLPKNLVHIDVDPGSIGRSYPAKVELLADAALALGAISEKLVATAATPSWAQKARDASAAVKQAVEQAIGPDHAGILKALREALPAEGNVVVDSTIVAYNWADSLLPIYRPGSALRPTAAGIGPALPLGIGAALGDGQPTVVIHGDGGIMLSITELASLAESNAPVVVLVFNDGGYGILRGIQAATFEGSRHSVDLHTPDFVGLAESMGVEGARVRTVGEFEVEFRGALASAGPYLIEIDLSQFEPMNIPIGVDQVRDAAL